MKYNRDGLTNYRKSNEIVKESHIGQKMTWTCVYKWRQSSPHKPNQNL